MDSYMTHIQETPSISKYGMNTVGKVQKYAPLYGYGSGLVFGLFGMIFSAFLYLIFKIARLKKQNWSLPLAQVLGWLPILWVGQNMVYESGRLTALRSGIVFFLGYPLFYMACILMIILLGILIVSFFSKKTIQKALKVFFLCGTSLLFVGCTDFLDFLFSFSCEYMEDSAHCYQESAVADDNPDDCEKVTYEGDGSNPPKDKCYLMIAENSGDPTDCDNVRGGVYELFQRRMSRRGFCEWKS